MGEVAALGTAVMWSLTSVLFTIAGRRVGSVIVNRTRLIFAVILLTTTHFLLTGKFIPTGATSEQWIWMGLSGVIGLVIGDALLFQAFVDIGPRLSMLIMALVPVITTILAWIFLGQHLTPIELLAIGIAVGGVGWVIWESNGKVPTAGDRSFYKGILLGVGGAIGQSVGLITAKKGLVGDLLPLSGTLLRMFVAMVVIWVITVLRGQTTSTLFALKDTKALRAIIGASIVGPFLGVWLSLIAIDNAPVGIASALMSLAPIFLLPLVPLIFQERVTRRVVLGTITAIVGVMIIFFVP